MRDAVWDGHADKVRALAELGVDVETPENNGATPAWAAAQNGHLEVLRLLAELGANVNTPMNDGFTPACIAAWKGHVEVLRLLAELGADVETPDNDGATPAYIAAENTTTPSTRRPRVNYTTTSAARRKGASIPTRSR